MDEAELRKDADLMLRNLPGWSFEAAYVGLRAGFRCEYCDRPLLRSVEDYDAWQNDHVRPQSQTDAVIAQDYVNNWALACKTCNFIKRHTVPAGAEKVTQRNALVALYREVMMARRARKTEILLDIREFLARLGIDDGVRERGAA